MNSAPAESKGTFAAMQFIRSALLNGNDLAQAALQVLPFLDGKIMVSLPKGVVPQGAEDFETGGKVPTPAVQEWRSTESGGETLLMIPTPTTDAWLVARIKKHLLAATNRACVIEDAVRRVGDPALAEFSTRYATFKTNIYHLLFAQDASEERIQATIGRAKSIPTFVGFLTAWDEWPSDEEIVSLSSSTVEALAAKTEEVFVGAFDGEGYVAWRRNA